MSCLVLQKGMTWVFLMLPLIVLSGVSEPLTGRTYQKEVSTEDFEIYQLFPQGTQPKDPVVVAQAAKAMIDRSPTSFIGLLLMGKLEYEAANYAGAVRWLKSARHACEAFSECEMAPSGVQPQWHALILHNLALTYTAMDRSEESCEVRQRYSQIGYDKFAGLNGISRPACCFLAENLVKLGRADEAREGLKSFQETSGAKNEEETLAVAESIDSIEEICSGDMDSLFDKYSGQVKCAEQAGSTPSFSLLSAAAYYSERHGDIDRARVLYKRTVSVNEPWVMSNPWLSLSRLSIRGGRWDDAKNDMRECWQWTSTKRQHVGQELQKEIRLGLAEFYLANGYAESGLCQAGTVRDSPVRYGFRLLQYSEQWEASLALVEYLCDQMGTELECEARGESLCNMLSMGVDRAQLRGRLAERSLRFRALVAKRLSRPLPLRDALETVDVPVWLWGDVIRLLGPHMARRLFNEHPLSGQRQVLYGKAIDVEIAAAGDDWATVLEFAGRGMSALPQAERLWYARLQALLAKALETRHGQAAAIDSCLSAYSIYPAVFWQLNVPLPVVIKADGSITAEKVKTCLLKTGRFVNSESNGLLMDLRCDLGKFACTLSRAGVDKPVKAFTIPLCVVNGARQRDDRADEERLNKVVLQRLFCGSELSVDGHDFDALEGRQVR